jgi:hypothetical protein
VLWGRVRHDAGFCCGLFRFKECRAHLRTYADSVGVRKRFWATAHRPNEAEQRILYERPPCDCGDHGRIDASSHPGLATQTSCCERCGTKSRRSRHAFQMTRRERAGANERETCMVPADPRCVRRSRGMDRAALLQAERAACFLHRRARVAASLFPIPSGGR